MDQNHIGDKGAQYLAEGLQKNKVRERNRVFVSLLFHKDTHSSPPQQK
jgi:hypothetical protein